MRVETIEHPDDAIAGALQLQVSMKRGGNFRFQVVNLPEVHQVRAQNALFSTESEAIAAGREAALQVLFNDRLKKGPAYWLDNETYVWELPPDFTAPGAVVAQFEPGDQGFRAIAIDSDGYQLWGDLNCYSSAKRDANTKLAVLRSWIWSALLDGKSIARGETLAEVLDIVSREEFEGEEFEGNALAFHRCGKHLFSFPIESLNELIGKKQTLVDIGYLEGIETKAKGYDRIRQVI